MNIGTIQQNASVTCTGKISTLTVAIVIALRTVNPSIRVRPSSRSSRFPPPASGSRSARCSAPRPTRPAKPSSTANRGSSLDKLLYITRRFARRMAPTTSSGRARTTAATPPTDTVSADDDGLPPLPGADEAAPPAGTDGAGARSSAEGAFRWGTCGRPAARTPEMAD